MIAWLRAVFAAKRLGLRDKGYIPKITLVDDPFDTTKKEVRVHRTCRTRLRVGINREGRAIHYCWRCEEILK